MQKRSRLVTAFTAAIVLVFMTSVPARAGRVADEIAAFDADAGQTVAEVEPLFTAAAEISLPLPADPTQALIDRTAALSADLGFVQDPGPAIRLAGLSDEVAGRLANVVQELHDCYKVTSAHFLALKDRLPEIMRDGDGLDVSQFTDIRECGYYLWQSSVALEAALLSPNSPPDECTPLGARNINVWPVLRFDGTCTNTTYMNDYLLIVEVGGHDVYNNNVGSNMVDLNFSPAGSTVVGPRGVGRARGCQSAIPGLAAGDCTPVASLLLDLAGEDIFGVKETPDHDAGCTNDLVVRRMVTVGVGFLGVGILRDAGNSQDKYTGKTGSLGTGHVFGIGILSDNGGNDKYLAVRNSQGFALVGGVGVLRDEAGNDSYDFYMPAPIDPSAPNETEGAGGVRDDQGTGVCDRIPRFVQGTANVLPGTVGVFIEDGGNDKYHGVFVGDFSAPLQFPSTRAGSLGFGNNQGDGIFFDRAGSDAYAVDNPPQGQQRGNGVFIPPGNPRTSEGGGAGVFIDR